MLGRAFVAPAQLNLRRELSGKSGNVTTLHHGEEVGVLDVRRRFVKIRSRQGMEGWVDATQLLSTEQMKQLRAASAEALTLPSEGSATVFEALNIHIDPNRQSPALARIDEGTYVAVIGHKLAPKNAAPAPPPDLITEKPQAPTRRKRERQTRSLRLPAPPKPPKPPDNWQELSTERSGTGPSTAQMKSRKDAETAGKKAAADSKPMILEDWTRIRTPNKESGWVLSRNLVMAIPDEVAQYAEGRRITSYFELGSVNDEEKGLKHNWLWTTSSTQRAYDFDSWRVFIWNKRRHRYETSYRQRDLEGYYPVVVDPADAGAFGRTFHLITKDDDGRYRRRTYVFDTVRVHLTTAEDYQPGNDSADESTGASKPARNTSTRVQSSWWTRLWEHFRARSRRSSSDGKAGNQTP